MKERRVFAVSHQFSGPLPPPDDLAKYDQIVPGAAERILQMAEKEQANRHSKDDKKLDRDIRIMMRGQWMGFFLALFFGTASVLFAFNGFEKLAALCSTPLIVWVCSIFVLHKTPKGNVEK